MTLDELPCLKIIRKTNGSIILVSKVIGGIGPEVITILLRETSETLLIALGTIVHVETHVVETSRGLFYRGKLFLGKVIKL